VHSGSRSSLVLPVVIEQPLAENVNMPTTIQEEQVVASLQHTTRKKCILRLLKWLIATVRRVANVHLRLFPNRRRCWGRNCLLQQFREQSHQLPQKVLRQFPTVANEELSHGFKGLVTLHNCRKVDTLI